ncbi:glycosyltransferase [Rhizobium sp. PAMB 3174]
MTAVEYPTVSATRFKLAVILDKRITIGGGFNQALTAAQQILRIAPESFDVELFTNIKSNIRSLAENGLSVTYLAEPRRSLFSRVRRAFTPRGKRLETTLDFDLEMETRGVDLVYFTSPSAYALDLKTIPYIFTIWDLCHLEHPEFPEAAARDEFAKREARYSRAIPRAFLNITDSRHTTELACHRYGVQRTRFLDMPFSPAAFTDRQLQASPLAVQDVMNRYRLSPGYFFYPAQFWDHKNHVRLLQAAAELKQRTGSAPDLVFAGSDQGHRNTIEMLATELGVAETTYFIGFVPTEDMPALYEAAVALAMPTYFGPSNLPPMEAWIFGKPVLYPHTFVDFVGDAAILFDPDDAHSLADAMNTVLTDENPDDWKERGAKRLEHFSMLRSLSEDKLLISLLKIRNRIALIKQ